MKPEPMKPMPRRSPVFIASPSVGQSFERDSSAQDLQLGVLVHENGFVRRRIGGGEGIGEGQRVTCLELRREVQDGWIDFPEHRSAGLSEQRQPTISLFLVALQEADVVDFQQPHPG